MGIWHCQCHFEERLGTPTLLGVSLHTNMLSPKNLQIISRELAIVWNDGSESYIGLESLRRACPCAVCKGEPDVLGRSSSPEKPHLGPASSELSGWELIGSYGFQPKWRDGHASGIFTWEGLQVLSSIPD